jgi:Zn-dependent peptidase ImmA (M78 family)/transcriptional regulator with XRE-family HTH domain
MTTRHDADLIIGEQLRKARLLLGLTLDEAAQEVGVGSQDILGWESEASRPSLEQLEKLGAAYGRGIDYFLRKTPTPPTNIQFRGKPSRSIHDLPPEARVVLGKFDELCREAVELETLLGRYGKAGFLQVAESVEPGAASISVRRELGVDSRPVRRLRELVERHGVRVFALPVPHDSFSGLSFSHREYGLCVLLNARDLPGRRNFTLAHELAHLVYQQGAFVCYIPVPFWETYGLDEYRANQFAVELLLPESAIIDDFRSRKLSRSPTEIDLGRLAATWGVSLQALGYRLESLGLIERGFTDTILEARPKYLKRPKSPRWERQLGRSFTEMAFQAYEKGLISSGKLARVLDLTVRKALEEAEKRRK